MKIWLIVIAVALGNVYGPWTADAMEITPPHIVLRQIVAAARDGQLHSQVEVARIRANNERHTHQYVLSFLAQFNASDLPHCNYPDSPCLHITVARPVPATFVFVSRVDKWVDGAAYEYFVLDAINEASP